jgi:hypothetical protein
LTVNVHFSAITQQEKGVWEFAYDPIENMIGDPPTDGTNWLLRAKRKFKEALPRKFVGELIFKFDRINFLNCAVRFEEKEENKLGSGKYGKVYPGTFEGNAVAVKVIAKDHSDDARKKKQKREMKEHFRLDHENVLKLLHVDDSREKT